MTYYIVVAVIQSVKDAIFRWVNYSLHLHILASCISISKRLWCIIIAQRIYCCVYISPDPYRFQNEQETNENFAFGLDWNGSHTSTAHIRVYMCCWFTRKCIFKPFFASNGILSTIDAAADDVVTTTTAAAMRFMLCRAEMKWKKKSSKPTSAVTTMTTPAVAIKFTAKRISNNPKWTRSDPAKWPRFRFYYSSSWTRALALRLFQRNFNQCPCR